MDQPPDRLLKQMAFIIEADKLKNIFRRSYIGDGSRRENDAEHSWHLSLMILILSEHSNFENLDILKTLKMVIIHDIVEIDAGDTFIYDEEGKKIQKERETTAANRLFGMLPDEQERDFKAIWEEFEDGKSPEATFAKSLDRLHPMMLNYLAEGKTWRENGVSERQVRKINHKIEDGSSTLWDYANSLITDASHKEWF